MCGAFGILIFIYPLFILFEWCLVACACRRNIVSHIACPFECYSAYYPGRNVSYGDSSQWRIYWLQYRPGIFGGTIPVVALALVELTGNKYAPAFYILFWAIIAIIAARYAQETYLNKLG